MLIIVDMHKVARRKRGHAAKSEPRGIAGLVVYDSRSITTTPVQRKHAPGESRGRDYFNRTIFLVLEKSPAVML